MEQLFPQPASVGRELVTVLGFYRGVDLRDVLHKRVVIRVQPRRAWNPARPAMRRCRGALDLFGAGQRYRHNALQGRRRHADRWDGLKRRLLPV